MATLSILWTCGLTSHSMHSLSLNPISLWMRFVQMLLLFFLKKKKKKKKERTCVCTLNWWSLNFFCFFLCLSQLVAPYQPVSMKVFHCPIDPRLTFQVRNIFLKKISHPYRHHNLILFRYSISGSKYGAQRYQAAPTCRSESLHGRWLNHRQHCF